MVSNNTSAWFTDTGPGLFPITKQRQVRPWFKINKRTKWTKYLDQIDEIIFVKYRC